MDPARAEPVARELLARDRRRATGARNRRLPQRQPFGAYVWYPQAFPAAMTSGAASWIDLGIT